MALSWTDRIPAGSYAFTFRIGMGLAPADSDVATAVAGVPGIGAVSVSRGLFADQFRIAFALDHEDTVSAVASQIINAINSSEWFWQGSVEFVAAETTYGTPDKCSGIFAGPLCSLGAYVPLLLVILAVAAFLWVGGPALVARAAAA